MEMDVEAAPTASNEEEDGLPAGGRSGKTDSTLAEKREGKPEGPSKSDKDADNTAKLTQSARTTSFEVQQTKKSLERPQDVSQINKTDDSHSKTSGNSMGSSLGKHSVKSINIAGDLQTKLTMATLEPEKSPKLSSEESAQSPSTKTHVPSSSVPASLPQSSSDAPDKPAKVSQPGASSDSTKSPAVIASPSQGNTPASSVKTSAFSSSEASSSSTKSASPSTPVASGLPAKNPAKMLGENISTKHLPTSSETKTSSNPSTLAMSTTGTPGKPLVKPEVMSKTSTPSQATPKLHSSQPSNPSPMSSLKPSLPKTPTAISSPTVSSSTSIKPTVSSTIVTKSTPSTSSSSTNSNKSAPSPSSVLPSSSVSSTSKTPQTPLSPYKSVPKIMPSVKPKINPPKFTSLVSSTAPQKPSTFQSSSSPSSSSNIPRPSPTPKPTGTLPTRPTATTSIPSLMSIKVTCPSIFSSARTSLQYSSSSTNRSLATSSVQSGSSPTASPRASLPLSRAPIGSPRLPPTVVGTSSTQRPSNPTQPQNPTASSRPVTLSRNSFSQPPQPSPSIRDPSLPIPPREDPNRELPTADFSVPDIRRDCPTGPDPPTPTVSSVPDVLRTGSEEEDRQLERMLRPTQFGSGIPPPNMPDLCRKGRDAPMGRVPTIALPSAEAGIDLLQPASVTSNPIPDLNESVSDRVQPSSTGNGGGQGSSEERMEVTREQNQGTSSVEEMQVVPSVEEAGTSQGASGDTGRSETNPRAVGSLTKGELPENGAIKKVQAFKMDVSSPMKEVVASTGIEKLVDEDGAVSGDVVSNLDATDDKKAVDSVTTDANVGASVGEISCDRSVPVKGAHVEEKTNSDSSLPVKKTIAMKKSPESVGGGGGKPQVPETVPNPLPKDSSSDAAKGERMTVERAEVDKDSLVGEESTSNLMIPPPPPTDLPKVLVMGDEEKGGLGGEQLPIEGEKEAEVKVMTTDTATGAHDDGSKVEKSSKKCDKSLAGDEDKPSVKSSDGVSSNPPKAVSAAPISKINPTLDDGVVSRKDCDASASSGKVDGNISVVRTEGSLGKANISLPVEDSVPKTINTCERKPQAVEEKTVEKALVSSSEKCNKIPKVKESNPAERQILKDRQPDSKESEKKALLKMDDLKSAKVTEVVSLGTNQDSVGENEVILSSVMGKTMGLKKTSEESGQNVKSSEKVDTKKFSVDSLQSVEKVTIGTTSGDNLSVDSAASVKAVEKSACPKEDSSNVPYRPTEKHICRDTVKSMTPETRPLPSNLTGEANKKPFSIIKSSDLKDVSIGEEKKINDKHKENTNPLKAANKDGEVKEQTDLMESMKEPDGVSFCKSSAEPDIMKKSKGSHPSEHEFMPVDLLKVEAETNSESVSAEGRNKSSDKKLCDDPQQLGTKPNSDKIILVNSGDSNVKIDQSNRVQNKNEACKGVEKMGNADNNPSSTTLEGPTVSEKLVRPAEGISLTVEKGKVADTSRKNIVDLKSVVQADKRTYDNKVIGQNLPVVTGKSSNLVKSNEKTSDKNVGERTDNASALGNLHSNKKSEICDSVPGKLKEVSSCSPTSDSGKAFQVSPAVKPITDENIRLLPASKETVDLKPLEIKQVSGVISSVEEPAVKVVSPSTEKQAISSGDIALINQSTQVFKVAVDALCDKTNTGTNVSDKVLPKTASPKSIVVQKSIVAVTTSPSKSQIRPEENKSISTECKTLKDGSKTPSPASEIPLSFPSTQVRKETLPLENVVPKSPLQKEIEGKQTDKELSQSSVAQSINSVQTEGEITTKKLSTKNESDIGKDNTSHNLKENECELNLIEGNNKCSNLEEKEVVTALENRTIPSLSVSAPVFPLLPVSTSKGNTPEQSSLKNIPVTDKAEVDKASAFKSSEGDDEKSPLKSVKPMKSTVQTKKENSHSMDKILSKDFSPQKTERGKTMPVSTPCLAKPELIKSQTYTLNNAESNKKCISDSMNDNQFSKDAICDVGLVAKDDKYASGKSISSGVVLAEAKNKNPEKLPKMERSEEVGSNVGKTSTDAAASVSKALETPLGSLQRMVNTDNIDKKETSLDHKTSASVNASSEGLFNKDNKSTIGASIGIDSVQGADTAKNTKGGISGDLMNTSTHLGNVKSPIHNVTDMKGNPTDEWSRDGKETLSFSSKTTQITVTSSSIPEISDAPKLSNVYEDKLKTQDNSEKEKADISREVCENKSREAAADILMSLNKDIIDKSLKTDDEYITNKAVVKDVVSVEQELKGLHTVSGFGTKFDPMKVECKTSGTHDVMALPPVSRFDTPVTALPLNDGSPDSTRFKRRGDLKQPRGKSILGITEKLAVANQMRQQMQGNSDAIVKESTSPRKMPGLIEMGVAKASRRKNLVKDEQRILKKSKPSSAPDSNDSGAVRNTNQAFIGQGLESSVGKQETTTGQVSVDALRNLEQPSDQVVPPELALSRKFSVEEEMGSSADSCVIIDLSSKTTDVPKDTRLVGNAKDGSANSSEKSDKISMERQELEKMSVCKELDSSVSSKTDMSVLDNKKEDDSFKYPRVKRNSGKDKITLPDRSIPIGGPTTRTRGCYKPPSPSLTKSNPKIEDSMEKNFPTGLKVATKREELSPQVEFMKNSVEVSTEPFPKVMDTETRRTDHTESSLSIRPVNSPGLPSSSKLLEVIRVAEEKGREIVKVNDVEVMREPVGPTNPSVSLLRKPSGSPMFSSVTVSTEGPRKDLSASEPKAISESVQTENMNKFPSGGTESWEFVAKVGEVELLRESPRAPPKATPPPMTITVESPVKKVVKEKSETSGRKPGRPPSMPPPSKTPDYPMTPLNMMEQAYLAHQNLRNHPLEVLVGMSNRPGDGSLLDPRAQISPLGMQMGSSGQWMIPTEAHSRPSSRPSGMETYLAGRSQSVGEQMSSESDNEKRKRGTPKGRNPPCPRWGSQEADMLSVKVDGHPLGTWSPGDWRSMPSMNMWPHGYAGYGPPLRPRGSVEPRSSRSVSPPHSGKDTRGMEQRPEDLSSPPLPRGRRESPHSFRHPFVHPSTFSGTSNYSNVSTMSYPSPKGNSSSALNLARSSASATPPSDTAMNLTMCRQPPAIPTPPPVLSSPSPQPSPRQSSLPVNLVKSRSSSPKTPAQQAPQTISDGRGAVLPGGIVVPNLPLIFGREYSLGSPNTPPSGRISHCSAEESRDVGENGVSQAVRCSSEPPREHLTERSSRDSPNITAFVPAVIPPRSSATQTLPNYPVSRPSSAMSSAEQMSTTTASRSTSTEPNLLPGGVVIPNLFGPGALRPGEEQWITSGGEIMRPDLPPRSASAMSQYHTEESPSKQVIPILPTPVPTVSTPPIPPPSTPPPPPPIIPQKTGPGRRGGRSETPPPDKYNFRVEEAHVVRSSDILPGGGHGGAGGKLFACDICSGVYRRAFSLKRHYLRAHINYCHLSERDLSNCGIVVGDKMAVHSGGSGRRPYVHTTMPRNVAKLPDDDEEPERGSGRRTLLRDLFRCHTCGVCFDEKKRLKGHLMEHQCGSNRPSLLRQHAATHHPIAPVITPKPAPTPRQQPSSPTPTVYICAYCDRRFSSAAVRRRHRKLHESSPGPHPCYLCETAEDVPEVARETPSFAHLEDLRSHMASIHKDVYHSCALCGERLPSILALEEHAEEHRSRRGAGDHSEEEEEEEDAELVRVAAAVAPSSQSSAPSEVVQSSTAAQGEEEEFRYTCGVCQKMFTNYVNMCRHRRLAHGAAQAKVTGKKTGVSSAGKSQVGGGDSESSSRSQSPVVVSQSSERVHRDLLDGEPSSSSSSSVPSPCPYPASSTVSANDPETIFYTRLAGNIRDNLLNYLDGKLNKQEISEKKMKENDRRGISNEHVGDDGIRTEPSWEKYNFPKDFQQMSFWDISTQLVVRNNLKKANSAPNIEPNPEQRPAFPETLALVENSKAGEIPLKVDEEIVKQEPVVEGEWSGLSGEWVRPRSYICCVCASRFGDLWSLEDHQLARHQNIWCTHLEVEDGAVVLPGSPKLSPGTANIAVSFLGDLLCRRPLGPRGALLSAPSVPPTLNNGMDSPSARCTKCSRVCPSLPDLHSHMLECGGDLAWAAWAGGSSPAASSRRNSRKWRPFGSRRRRQRGRRGLKRNIPSSPVKMHRARHRGTDSDSIQRMIANLPPKRATRRVIQFNEDEIKTRSQATIHSVSFPGNFVRVSGYKTSPGVKGAPPTVAKRGRPPKNPLPPTPLNIEGLAMPSTSMASMSSMGMSSPGTSPGGPNLQGVVVKKARGRPPGSKSKTNLSNMSSQDYSLKRRFGESSGDGYSPESDRYGVNKRSRIGTSPVNQHQSSSTTPNAPGEPYICKGCGAVFDNASSCERHGKKCVFRRQMPAAPPGDGIRVASSGNARPVHSCPHCGKNFTYATPMEKHVRICGSSNSGFARGPPVHVRRATAPSVLGRPPKVEFEEDVKKDSEESPIPSEEVEVPPSEPPQEPDMPHLQKEEPVASPPVKEDDIPVLTPVEPEDETEEAQQEIIEKDSEEVVKVDTVVNVEEPEELVTSSEATVVENDSDLPVNEESVIKPADETVFEIKEEEIDRETFEIQVEETPTVELEKILAGCQMEEGPIPGESTPVEVAVEEPDKEEVSEEAAFRTSGKRTRGSNSFGGQVSKKTKVEEEVVEPAPEVEVPKKKGGKKSLGGVARGKSPKGAKINRGVSKGEDEIETPEVEDKKEELVVEEVNAEEVEVKEERLEKLEKGVDVQEKDNEQPEKEEVKETTSDKESSNVIAEKETMSVEKEEDKEEREGTSANESRGKRGRRGKHSRNNTTTETLAKATPEKVESASSRQGKRKGASVERPSSPKTDEAAEVPTVDKEPKATRSAATSVPPKQIVEVSTAEPSKEETNSSKKEDITKEEAEEPSKPNEEVVENITKEEVAVPKEVEEVVDTKDDANQAKSEEMDAEVTPKDDKQEDDAGEDDDEDSKSEKDSKLRGVKGTKGKVSKKSHKKKKKQEMKREVENFWCNVCKMGYSSAFNLVKHGQSQKHKWNLRLEKEKEEAEASAEKKTDSKDESEKGAGDDEPMEEAKKVDGGKNGTTKEEPSKNDAAEVVSKEMPTEEVEEEKEDHPKNGKNLKGGSEKGGKTTTGKKKGASEVKAKEEQVDDGKGKEDDKSEISEGSENEVAVTAKDDKVGKTKVKDKKGKDAAVPEDKGNVKGKGKFQEQKHGKKTPEKKTAEKKSPEKKSSEKKSPEKKVVEKKAAEKKSPEKKSQEKKSPDKKSQEKKAAENIEKDTPEKESKDAVLNPGDSDGKVTKSDNDSKDNDPEMEEPLVRLKEDRSKKSITSSAPAVESAVNADSSVVSSDTTSNQEGSKKSTTKENTDGTLIGQGINERGMPGKGDNQPAPAQEAEGNITKVSPEDSVAAAPESATVIEGTKNTCESVQCGVWPEAALVSAPTQEFLQPPVPGPTGYNTLYEWDSNQQPSTILQPTQLQQPTQMQTQTQLQQSASQQANSGQHVHLAQQDSWGIYGGWEAPTVDHSPTPPSPGLWRYQPPPTPMPWADPQHSLSPILRVPSYTEDPPPQPVTHPSPPNPSLGSILDSVNRILAEDVPVFDSSRMNAATVPEEEYGGVGLFGEGSLAELQRAMGATDEEMAMLQQLGTGPLDFVYDNNMAPSNVNYGTTEVHDQVGPLPNAELVDLDNQVASVNMVGDGPMEESETATMPPVAVEGTTGLLVGDGRGGKKKRCGPPPSKCKRFPPPARGESNRGWRGGGRRPLLAQASLASAHLLISQYEKKEMVCPVCNRHFLGLAALETHVAWVHKVKDPKQHILEGENAGQSSGKKANPASNSLRELVVGRGASGVVVGGGVASSPTPSRRLPCFVCKELYSDVISLNHHIAQQHLRRRPGEGGIVPEMDGDLKSQMTSALGGLLGKALANMRSRSDSPAAKTSGLPVLGGKSPLTSTFPKLNLLNKSLDLMSKISFAGESSMRKSYGGPSSSDSPTENLNRLEPPAESPEVLMFRRDDGMDPTEWSSDGEDSAKGQEGETLQEDGEVPSFHHVCPFCGDRFQRLSSRNRHIMSSHRELNSAELLRLRRSFSHESSDFDELLGRGRKEEAEGAGALPKDESADDAQETGRRHNHHPCPACQLSFLRHSQLEAHLKRAHNGSDSQLPDSSDSMMECPICRESMNHFLKLCKHVKAKHREWCINCFTTDMHHHLILRKESPEESMVIRKKFLVKMKAFPVLRVASPTPSSRSSEEESYMDPDPKGNYLCSVCGVNFKSPQGVIRHLNLEHNSNHLEGALPLQKIFPRSTSKEYRGRTGGGSGSDIKAKAEAALRELNLSQKLKLGAMANTKGLMGSRSTQSRKLSSSSVMASTSELGMDAQTSGIMPRGVGRGRGSNRRGRGRRGGRALASSDVEKSLFDVYEFEDDDDDLEDTPSRVGSADGSSRVGSECGDDDDEDDAVEDDGKSGVSIAGSIRGKRLSVDSSSSEAKYSCNTCGKGYKSLTAFWKHSKGVRGSCAGGGSSPRCLERSGSQESVTSGRTSKMGGRKGAKDEDEALSDVESEAGSGRVLRRLRGSTSGAATSEVGSEGSKDEAPTVEAPSETPKRGEKGSRGGKGKKKAGGDEDKKPLFSGGETVRTYGGKRSAKQQAEDRKSRGGGGGDEGDSGSGSRRSMGASEAAFDALRGGGGPS